MSLVVEAVRAIGLPCSLTLLVIGGAALIAGRLSAWTAAGVVVSAGAGAWLAATGRAPGGSWERLLPALLLVGAGLLVALPSRRRSAADGRHTGVDLGTGTLAGLAAGLVWVPCVGEELGEILTRAVNSGDLVTLPQLVVYVGFVLTPIWGVAAWQAFRAPAGKPRPRYAAVGAGALALLGLLTATGWLGDITGALYRLSTNF